MFDTVVHTLSADVASAGTFTVSYPAGRSAGDYTGAHAHKLYAINADFSAPNNFTLSFGASSITVTYNGSTTLPSGATVRLQLDRLGQNSNEPFNTVVPSTLVRSPLHLIDLGSPDQADTDGILDGVSATDSAQTYDSSDFVAAFSGTLDVPRNLTATGSAGSDHVVTVTGTDADGSVVVESLTLSGTNTIAGKKAFKTVTGVAVAVGAASDTLDLGWGDVLGLPVYVSDAAAVVAEFEDGVLLKREAQKHRVPFQIDQTDLLAGTPISVLSPVAGTISKVVVMTWKAVTTGGAITMKVNNTSVDGLSITVADAAAAGDVDQDTPTAGHASTVVAVDDELEIIPASEFAMAGAVTGYIEIELTSAQELDGTLVAGVTSKATATTGDVRGTYDPTTACDGATAFALLASLSDPANDGVPQYAG